MAASALLVLNRRAGTGHAEGDADRLAGELKSGFGAALTVDVAIVDDHPTARSAAASFAGSAGRPSLVVAAGGGGTLRAVVEGLMDTFGEPPNADVVSLGALRMGSGNVISRRVGIPVDPSRGARVVGDGFARGRASLCAVMRCTHGTKGGGSATRHAVTMCGLGAWGRVPGDIARWREAHRVARKRAARLVGLERVNAAEYLAFGAGRILGATVSARRSELVEVEGKGRMRLVAAVALTVPLPPLPDPGVSLGDEAIGLTLLPRFAKPYRRRLERGAGLTIRLVDRESTEFFLDEDPEVAYGWLRLEVAGRLTFVAGDVA